MKVKFSDVVRRANTKEDRFNTDKEFYVGGEHMITGEYLITRRGTIAGSNIGPMFYFGFKKGQVLLASRSPDLKKAGMVTFDGICSEKTFVIETKDESVLLQDFLPAIVRSESFWKYANDNQSGSVNHFINWTTFANYEFDLPDIETQRKLSALLWTMERTKTAYKNLIAKTDELVKSQFVEMFGIPETGETEWPEYKLQTLLDMGWITYHLDGNHGSEYPRAHEFVESGVPYISANCVVDGRIDFANAKYVTEARANRFRKGIAENKDVLFAHNATVGPVAILETTEPRVILGTSLTAFRCNTEHILPEFLKAYLECPRFVRQYEAEMQQSTRKQVPITTQRKYTIVVPDIDRQKEITRIMEQSDKSKFAAQQALADLTGAQKALMRQYLA